MAKKLRVRQVFVPGGQPEHTYVKRAEGEIEDRLAAARDNLCKLVTLTGPTKSGKSVVTKRLYPESASIWVDGGSIGQEDDFWNLIVDRLGGSTEKTIKKSKGVNAEIGGEAGGEAGIKFIAKAQGKISSKIGSGRHSEESGSRHVASKHRALELLGANGTPLIIDDFHYLDREIQGNIVRALKALIFKGHPVIALAIPHRKYDAVRVEKEMTARVEQISIPPWTQEELQQIPFLGFPLLKLRVNDGIVPTFLTECLSSPHLMQEFCRQLCVENRILEECDEPRQIGFKSTAQKLLEGVAQGTSKTVFDRLSRGPSQRTDRMQRTFKDGGKGDIYLAVLMAIARLKPGVAKLEYEEIRAALKETVLELPQANEVSRVLEHMSRIQADDKASAPVLDWEKKERLLYITDPYFAFFLRWGLAEFRAMESS